MDLPDDILFLICQTLFTNRNISHRHKVRQISRVGRVNRHMRQFEHMFWRALIKGIAARPIKMPKYLKVIYSILKTSLIISKNDPKHIYIYTHFSCHSCGEKSKLSCKKCKDNICEDCAPYFRHDCFGAVDPTDLQCTSCVKRCPACTAPYCNECSEYCVQCPDRFCFRCIEHDAPGGHTFGDGLRNDYCKMPSSRRTIKERKRLLQCHIKNMPQEILVLVFEYFYSSRDSTNLEHMRDVVNFGMVARCFRMAEAKFWSKVVKEGLKMKLEYERPPNQSFYLHLAHMPKKLRNNPKQMVLYSYFCCDHCGQKNVTTDCHGCFSQVCQTNGCGRYVKCHCREKAFHCQACHDRYYCEHCDRDLCKECVRECVVCRDEFCKYCWFLPDVHECMNSDSSSEAEAEVEKMKKIIKCIQCTDEIQYDEEDESKGEFGECQLCEYYNEINDYKLCKSCIVTCQFCNEQMCQNCMTLYHEPCEQWLLCKTCGTEWSRKDGSCRNCGTFDCCLNCQFECDKCGESVCKCRKKHVAHGTHRNFFEETPAEILLLILEEILSEPNIDLVSRTVSVINFSMANKYSKKIVDRFWSVIRTKELNSQLRFAPNNHLNYIPKSQQKNPKQQFLWQHLSCACCGHFYREFKPIELKSGMCITCLECGSFSGPFTSDAEVIYFCPNCYKDKKRGCCEGLESLTTNSEISSVLKKQEKSFKCIWCHDNIEYDEKDDERDVFGQCQLCKYYNEINDYKLCKSCIVTCQFCNEQMCQNCMTLYHEPCEQWLLCKTCDTEWSRKDGSCRNCGTFDCCLNCQFECDKCGESVCKKCYKKHVARDTLPELPDDVLLIIFKHASDFRRITTVKNVKKVLILSSVNKQFKRVEGYFWRQLIDRNPFFTSKLKKSAKFTPRDLHLRHYFGCNDCHKLTSLQCGTCDTRMCLECYQYSRINPCACMSDSNSANMVYCRSCIGRCPNYNCKDEVCPNCPGPIHECDICEQDIKCPHRARKLQCKCGDEAPLVCDTCHLSNEKKCHTCLQQFCTACRTSCRICYKPLCQNDKCAHAVVNYYTCSDCVPFPGLLLYLPYNVILLILEMILFDPTEERSKRIRSVQNIGGVTKKLNVRENYFWKLMLEKSIQGKIRLVGKKNLVSMSSLDNSQRPKQILLRTILSCFICGDLNTHRNSIDLRYGGRIRCRKCHAYHGPYFPENGDQMICDRCCKMRMSCCRDPQPIALKTVLETCLKCIRCKEAIHETDVAECTRCREGNNEIPGYKICYRCVFPCRWCKQKFCSKCMDDVHAPQCKDPRKKCQSCYEKTMRISYCTICLRSGCDTCQLKCDICLATACGHCMQVTYEHKGKKTICSLCQDDADAMEVD